MNIRRIRGLEKEISKKIAMMILTEVKNEKLKSLVVHKVEVSSDGRYADVTFSILDASKKLNKEKLLEDLNKVKGFFRSKLSTELKLRYVPEIRVHLDDTVEYAVNISKLIDEVIKKK